MAEDQFVPITDHQIIASLRGGRYDFGDFEKCNGGDDTTNFEEYQEAGNLYAVPIAMMSRYSDITLERGFVPGRDMDLLAWQHDVVYLNGIDRDRRLLCTKRYMTADFKTIIATEAFLVLPISIKTPNGTAGASNVGMVSVQLKVVDRISGPRRSSKRR